VLTFGVDFFVILFAHAKTKGDNHSVSIFQSRKLGVSMFANISIWQLLIVLAIVVMLFGTKKLRNIGSDLGSAIKGFKGSMAGDDKSEDKGKAVENKTSAEQPASAASAEKQKESQ